MRVSEIEVKNWKSIGIEPPLKIIMEDITVISGTNDSGKSSALEAAALALYNLSSSKNETLDYLTLTGGQHNGSKEPESVTISFKLTEEEIEAVMIRSERDLTQIADVIEQTLENIHEFLKTAKISIKVTELGQHEFYSVFNKFSDKILIEEFNQDIIKYFDTYVQQAALLGTFLVKKIIEITNLEDNLRGNNVTFIPSNRSHGHSKKFGSKDSDEIIYNAEELVEFVQNILTEQERRSGNFSKFLEYVKVLFPDVERLEINTPVGGMPEKDIFLVWKKNNIEQYQPLSRSGSGISNALYLASKLLTNYNSPCVGFIDEPENGLHPSLQIRFVRLLKKLSKDFPVQWLVATHSPFIMQNLKNNDVLMLVEHNGSQSLCRQIDVTQKQEVLHALGAYLPFMLNANGVIFTEGPTESIILPILLSKAGLDIDKERILIIPLGGENLFHIDPSDLKKIHEKTLVIIDSDLYDSIEKGGSIKANKQDYKQKCAKSDIDFIMPTDYRTLENMYPLPVLAKVLGITESELNADHYAQIPQIKDKIKIGEHVASNMTTDEAKSFPLVSLIFKWWKS